MNETKLNEILAGLPEEQKAKAAACKDSKELFAFLSEAGVSLPDELLDGAAGGNFIVAANLYKPCPNRCGNWVRYDWGDSPCSSCLQKGL